MLNVKDQQKFEVLSCKLYYYNDFNLIHFVTSLGCVVLITVYVSKRLHP